ncbi:MAG: hypothetical protein PWP23_1398 [Candidatus Sumerlaeota bacterium]|nr:hypothetical protein [Candidatus Sumerlaeota bacterium]
MAATPPHDDAAVSPAGASLFRLDGRTALVTGGSGVLGGAMARGLAQAGARVALAARTAKNVEAAAADLRSHGAQAIGVAMDACETGAIRAAVEKVERELGPVDILVNAAGGNQAGATTLAPERTFAQLDPDALRKVVDLNLFGGAMLPALVVGQCMIEHNVAGSIINITSVSAATPLTRVAGYSAAKAAVGSFTQWLAVHLALELNAPIRVNAIMPGFFLTEQNRFLLTNEDGSLTERGRTIIEHTPMKRFGSPGELAGACVFLASPASKFVTGTTLTVDGGFTAFSGV